MSVTNTSINSPSAKRCYLLLASIGLLIVATFFNLPASANSVTYMAPSDNHNGSFTGEIPIKRIGSLLLPKAVVQFKNSEVNVLAVPDWLFDRSTVLAGSLVKMQVEPQGQSSNVRGLVYFADGQWLGNLGSLSAKDVIDTVSGERLYGSIRSRLEDAFAFKPEVGAMRKIAFSEIRNINSPRAYIFTFTSNSSKVSPADFSIDFETTAIAFSPTFGRDYAAKSARVPKSTLSGTEPGISNSQIAALTGVNLIMDLAPAVAIPLTLNHHNIAQAQQTINLFTSEQQRAQGLPVPLNYSTYGP